MSREEMLERALKRIRAMASDERVETPLGPLAQFLDDVIAECTSALEPNRRSTAAS